MPQRAFSRKRSPGRRLWPALALVSCLALASCQGVIGKPIPVGPAGPASEKQLFSGAEKLFSQGRLEEARPLYQEYVTRFPGARDTPAVLLKLAAIDSAAGRHGLTQKWYREILARFPRTVYAPEARVGLLQSLLASGSAGEVMNEAPKLLAAAASDTERSRILALAGQAAMAAQSPADAFRAYSRAEDLAPESARAALAGPMAKATARMSDVELSAASGEAKGCVARAVLAAESSGRLSRAGRFKDAEALLQAVMAACPRSPLAGDTAARLEEIKRMASFRPDVLGCLLPLTGQLATFGQSVLEGAELAVSLYSQVHPGREVSLLVEDSRSDPAAARQGLQSLADRGAALVVGPMVAAESVADLAKQVGIPAVVFTQKPLNLTEDGFLFRNYLTPGLQAEALASYFTDRLALSRFAILHPADDYGKTCMNAFWDAVMARGGQVTATESYPPGQTDVGGSIRRLAGGSRNAPNPPDPAPAEAPQGQPGDQEQAEAGQQPEGQGASLDFQALFIPDVPQQAGLILPQLAFHDVTGVLVAGTNLWHGPKLAEVAGTASLGTLCPDLFFAGSDDPLVVEFVDRFRNAFGRDPGVMEALGFDTVRMALHALSLEGVTSRKALRNALVNMGEYQGITGRTRFLPTGEVQKTLVLLKATPQGFEEVR